MSRVLRSPSFWIPFVVVFALTGVIFMWELGLLPWMRLTRIPATRPELLFTAALCVLLSLNTGLFFWNRMNGTCPVGARRATGAAGIIGAFTLLCPICLALPVTIVGVSFGLAVLSPFLPLLRIVALVLLLATAGMLRPR